MKFTQAITAANTGWSARLLPSVTGTNTNAIPTRNCSEVEFGFDLTRVASTDLQFTVWGTNDDNPVSGPAAASWRQLRSENIVTGVGTLSAYSQIDTSAVTRSLSTRVDVAGLVAVQLRGVMGTGSTTDTLTITASIEQER
jgi:hypothetical protein